MTNLELGDTGRAYVRDLQLKRAARKAAQEDEKRSLARLRAYLGSHDTGSYEGMVIVQRVTVTQRRFDGKRFADEHPELDAEYRSVSESERVDIADGE